MALLFPDELAYNYIRPLYTPYRAALPDPTVLPVEDDIMWNVFLGGVKDTAIIFVEDFQQPDVFNLGWSARKWRSQFSIYSMTVWTNEGKPPYLKELSTFFEKYLIVKGMPNALKAAGLTTFRPSQFQLSQGITSFRGFGAATGIQNPETDWWVLAITCVTEYLSQGNPSP